MGYDFIPRHKKAGDFHLAAFSWPWMLNEGVGLPIGFCEGFEPASHFYQADKKGRNPVYNDGYHVTARQAKAMALMARYLVSKHRMLRYQWNHLPAAKREALQSAWDKGDRWMRLPVRVDFVDKMEAFSVWAEQSGGFRIY